MNLIVRTFVRLFQRLFHAYEYALTTFCQFFRVTKIELIVNLSHINFGFLIIKIFELKELRTRGRVQTTWTEEGRGGLLRQMTTTLNNSYLVKVST